MVKDHPANRRIRSVWTGPQSPVGHVCQIAVVTLCALILVFAPLAFGAVRFWALGPILIVIGLSGVLWTVRILSTWAYELGGDDSLPKIKLWQLGELNL